MMREYVPPTPRKPMTPKRKAEVFLHRKGRCDGCGLRLKASDYWEADHGTSLYSGGKDELENLFVRCGPCHRGKTDEKDAPKHAKIDRIHKRTAGTKPKSRLTHPTKVRGFDGVVRERAR